MGSFPRFHIQELNWYDDEGDDEGKDYSGITEDKNGTIFTKNGVIHRGGGQ